MLIDFKFTSSSRVSAPYVAALNPEFIINCLVWGRAQFSLANSIVPTLALRLR
jgi:hypothetical protein